MNFPKHVAPFFLASAIITLVMVSSNDPWWTITGASQNLLTIHVSPFYLLTSAIGLSPTVPIAQILGPPTRILLALAFLSLEVISIIQSAWWRNIAVCFSLSALAEVYLSFALLYHAAETSLLGTYGVIPPSSGAAQLSTVIIGLDLNSHLAFCDSWVFCLVLSWLRRFRTYRNQLGRLLYQDQKTKTSPAGCGCDIHFRHI